MKKQNNAYFAGNFDGEGCIYMKPHNAGWRLVASVSACHYPVLEYYQFTFKGYTRLKPAAKNKTMWEWSIHKQSDLKLFLDSILPYSIEKADQIQLGTDWLHLRSKYPRNKVPKELIEYGKKVSDQLKALKKISYSPIAVHPGFPLLELQSSRL